MFAFFRPIAVCGVLLAALASCLPASAQDFPSRSVRIIVPFTADWSFQATRDDHRRFVRASGAARAKALARFPFVP